MTAAPPSARPEPPATLTGVIERLTYQSDETGYTVARVTDEGGRLVTVVGHLPGVHPGEAVALGGRWVDHPRHGRQFAAETCRLALPATAQGIETYLGSGLIRGVGPVGARKIVAHFGLDTLAIIEETPARLAEVPGIGAKRVAQIATAWAEQKAIKEVMLALQSLGVSTSHAVRIYKAYGDEAIAVLRADPYRLARDVHGIGFVTADTIARPLGLPPDAPERVAASVRHRLSQVADDDGHVCLPRSALVEEAQALLARDGQAADWPGLVQAAIDRLVERRDLWLEADVDGGDDLIYLAPFRHAEVGVANRLMALLNAPVDRLAAFATVEFERAFAWLAERGGITLTERQQAAVRTALTERVSVLTGGPGTGKTTCLRSVVRLARAKGATVSLLAPTGRAAKRLSDLTSEPASTIHRLLRLRPGGGADFDDQRPLETDLVIVDEVSMLDLLLANTLLKAVPPGAHLLLVGDVDQLPSVGPGSVLADVIRSETVPVVRLDTVFRQAQESLIIQNAYRVNRGELPAHGAAGRALAPREDYFLLRAETPEEAADLVVELVAERLPRRYGFGPGEVQVLAPMHRGPAGVGLLNERLQARLNPPAPHKPELRGAGRLIRLGDRLLVTRNDYERQVFNGDLGMAQAIDPERDELTVRLDDGRLAIFPRTDVDELTLAYALSIHKAQGSEFRAVVLPMLTSHYVMLARNLLYTGLTRARELAVIVGQPRALAIAARNDRIAHRHGRLASRLSVAAAARAQAGPPLLALARSGRALPRSGKGA
ncbi:MAG: ATP-dependent RecD-like DNA helicase [Chloroflexi bacterium]|nr:ATP-dependent RecD-like DNA helicase [Chloroflexota bacterium]